MKTASTPQLYWKVCLINGTVFVAAAALLVLSPATVSAQVNARELLVLASGVVVILVTNALLLRGTLAPLDRLIQLMDTTDAGRPDRRLPIDGGGVASRIARSVNALQDRLEGERAMRNVRALRAQEAERERIAHELHDEVGQRLTVVLLGVTRALHYVSVEGEGELRLVQDNARASLDEVHRLVRGLRPGVLEDLGLVPALDAMAGELSTQTGVLVRCHLERRLPSLGPDVELVMFRVAQEALTNVTRHANAKTAEIVLTRSPNGVSLFVRDDGCSIGVDAIGDGIRGMRERALYVGGGFTVRPRSDRSGTEVQLDVPLGRAVG